MTASAVNFNDLVEVRLIAPARALKLTLTHPTGVTATGYNSADEPFEPVQGGTPNQPHLTVFGDDLKRVVLNADPAHEICILQACVVAVEELNRHLQNELARWSQEDDVLEPHTTYRLKMVTTIRAEYEGELAGYRDESKELTEYAYFRTGGPPGLEKLPPPEGLPNESEFESGLDDLTRYVRYTVPNTVPAPGEKPPLPRPVYRAYDVGVRFNVNYVELMYRLAGRDLGLYLYDNNNRPVRDVKGRLIVLSNRWAKTEEATLTEGEERWLYLLGESGCAPATPMPQEVLSDTTLVSASEGQVLEADTLYEARLVPLLLHETFSKDLVGWNTGGGALSDWERRGHGTLRGSQATVNGTVVRLDGSPNLSGLDPLFDFIVLQADTARPLGRYRIVSVDDAGKMVTVDGAPRFTTATSGWEIPELGAIIVKSSAETTLVRDGSENWGDYRLSALLRATGDKPVGPAFRYRQGSSDHYRFTMDRDGSSGRGRRILQKVVGGISEALAQDEFDHQQDRDYLVTAEVIGPMLRIYQDGALVFEENDGSLSSGGIGLHSGGSIGSRFGDVRVDDFGVLAPVAYRFSFTTSRFTNFFHQLHSFQDETWRAALAPTVDVAAIAAAAVPPTTPTAPSEAEARAYEALAAEVLGAAAAQNPAEVQVTRVERTEPDGTVLTLALLIQGPEPIDWKRTHLEVQRAERQVLQPELPGGVKLTDVTLGTNEPNEESITLLLRETTDLDGYGIDYRSPSDPGAELAWTPYYTFGQEGRLPAGTRVRVFAGNEADAPPVEPGVIRRFVASQGEPGQLRLSAQDGARLRIRGPGRTGGHARHFLPNRDYVTIDARVLRKADGTGFFVMPAAPGSALSIGQYRLKLTYRRDNTGVDPSSLVFSEAGDSADERVALDLPW